LNPPYKQSDIEQFVGKQLEEVEAGRTTQAILLTHNFTDTMWSHAAEAASQAICFTRGRIRFVRPDSEKTSPTQGSAFFYFGDHAHRFIEVFGPYGWLHTRQ
jgi:hypothetical protein